MPDGKLQLITSQVQQKPALVSPPKLTPAIQPTPSQLQPQVQVQQVQQQIQMQQVQPRVQVQQQVQLQPQPQVQVQQQQALEQQQLFKEQEQQQAQVQVQQPAAQVVVNNPAATSVTAAQVVIQSQAGQMQAGQIARTLPPATPVVQPQSTVIKAPMTAGIQLQQPAQPQIQVHQPQQQLLVAASGSQPQQITVSSQPQIQMATQPQTTQITASQLAALQGKGAIQAIRLPSGQIQLQTIQPTPQIQVKQVVGGCGAAAASPAVAAALTGNPPAVSMVQTPSGPVAIVSQQQPVPATTSAVAAVQSMPQQQIKSTPLSPTLALSPPRASLVIQGGHQTSRPLIVSSSHLPPGSHPVLVKTPSGQQLIIRPQVAATTSTQQLAAGQTVVTSAAPPTSAGAGGKYSVTPQVVQQGQFGG